MAQGSITEIQKGVYLIQAKAPEPLKTLRNVSQKIINYGTSNNYPQEVLRAVNKSSYTSACIRTFANYLYGEGLKADRQTKFSETILSRCFTPTFLKKMCYDYAQFGGFSLHLLPNMNKRIDPVRGVHHVDFSIVRLGMYDETTYETHTAWLSENWEQYTKKEFKPKEFPLFNFDELQRDIDKIQRRLQEGGTIEKSDLRGYIYYAKQYKAGEPFYPTPLWASALNWVYADGEISVFHANNVDNGFFPSTIIFHPGLMDGTTEDGRPATEVVSEKLKEFQGSENAGKIFNLFGTDQQSAPQVIQFNSNNNADLFNTLGDIIDKKIVAAFQMPKILAGIETTGSLGATNEIANAIEWYNAVIKSDIDFIETELNTLASFMDGYDGTKFTFSQSKPINYLDSAFLSYLDESEIREAMGYPAQRPSANNNPTV